MSVQSLLNQIASVDRDIHSLENQIHAIEGNISRKQRDATGFLEKISREKDLNRVISLNKDLTRKQDEISRLDRDKSTKAKSLSDKQRRRSDLQAQLNKLEQAEREKTKKEQKEIHSLQQEIAREMERQRFQSLKTTEVIRPSRESEPAKQYDVFISHASEDKDDFVRTFANSLKSKGLVVWYDEFELSVGDSLRRKIDQGLRNSRYGIVVLSVSFFNKDWPQRELDGLFSREDGVILPIWHKISKDEVKGYSPMIAGLMALNTSMFTIEEISDRIAAKVKGDGNVATF